MPRRSQKLENLMKLYDLFRERGTVSVEKFRELDIPKRTAFRYLNDLRDAGLEIEYNKEKQSYQLVNWSSTPSTANDLSLHQMLVVVIALNLAKGQVNEVYRAHIDEVLEKLAAKLPYQIDEIMQRLEIGQPLLTSADQSPTFTKLLIEAAILMERGFDLSFSSRRRTLHQTFNQPSLLFQGDWLVRDNRKQELQIPIHSVKTVQVK